MADRADMSGVVVIPARNEAETIAAALTSLHRDARAGGGRRF